MTEQLADLRNKLTPMKNFLELYKEVLLRKNMIPSNGQLGVEESKMLDSLDSLDSLIALMRDEFKGATDNMPLIEEIIKSMEEENERV